MHHSSRRENFTLPAAKCPDFKWSFRTGALPGSCAVPGKFSGSLLGAMPGWNLLGQFKVGWNGWICSIVKLSDSQFTVAFVAQKSLDFEILKSSNWNNILHYRKSWEWVGKIQASGHSENLGFLPCKLTLLVGSPKTLPLRPDSSLFRLDQLGRGSWEIVCSWKKKHMPQMWSWRKEFQIKMDNGYTRYNLSSITVTPPFHHAKDILGKRSWR